MRNQHNKRTHCKNDAKTLKRHLVAAVLMRNIKALQALLLAHPDLSRTRSTSGMPLLALGAALGDGSVCQALLDCGADLQQGCTTSGATPLIMAAFSGHTSIVQMLLESKQGGNVGRRYMLQQHTAGGETALMAAAKQGHLDTVQLLLASGAEPTAANKQGMDALMLACRHNRPTVVQCLTSPPCQLSCWRTDASGMTPLMHAASSGAEDVVALLLEHADAWGVQLGATDDAGDDVMVHACRGGSAQVLQLLYDAGLQPCGALVASARSTMGGDSSQQGIRADGSNGVKDSRNCPGITHASMQSDPSGVGSDAVDGSRGSKLLYQACLKGNVEAVAWLLKIGVDVNNLVADGPCNPVLGAVQGNHPAVLHFLLSKGARIDARDDRGHTPLMFAAEQGLSSMAELLVHKGADMLAVDLHGRVARQVAYHHQHHTTAEVLTQLARMRMMVEHDEEQEQQQPAWMESSSSSSIPLH